MAYRKEAASELHLGRDWNTVAIRELIEQKTSAVRKPAFLLTLPGNGHSLYFSDEDALHTFDDALFPSEKSV